MKTYEIADYSGNKPILLMGDEIIISAKTGRKALDIYLKENNIKTKVKCSSSDFVHYKVTPVIFENGKKYIDQRNGQRALWYQIIQLVQNVS